MISPAQSPSNYLSPTVPRVFAHRGLAVDLPENTPLAFQAAINLGVSYVETDVRVSSDGKAVIAHDGDLRRVAGINGLVNELTMAELRKVDLGLGQGFVTLEEVLDQFRDTRFNIDVKTDAAAQPTIRAIRRTNSEARVLLASFVERRRRRIARMAPEIVTSVGSAAVAGTVLGAALKARWLVRFACRDAVAIQVPQQSGLIKIVTDEFIGVCHQAGYEVHVWTINNESEMRDLIARGVDGIITDRADVALNVVSG